MQRARSKKPSWQINIARERIEILLNLAKKEACVHPERCKRYVELARKIGMRYNLRLSKTTKKSICKKCNMMLIYGKTALVRLDSKKKNLNIICKNCNNIIRIPYRSGE